MPGKRGPAPTPTDILKIRGSRVVEGRKNEPKPPKGAPRCPSRLTKEEKLVWKQLVAILKETNVLTMADGNAMACYCVMWCEWWRCDAHLKKYGLSFPQKKIIGKGEDAKTEVIGFLPFPELTQRNRLFDQLLRLGAEFGLTPAARTRIQVETKPEAAPVRKRERRA